MPPKTPNSNGDESKANEIVALCHVMMSCEEFKVDNNKLAPLLGIAQGKNVPRKINSIVTPYGFEFKNGKLTKLDGDAAAPATPKLTKDAEKNDEPSTPTSKKRASPKKKDGATPKTPTSTKKRKVEATTEEDDPVANVVVKTEAGKDDDKGLNTEDADAVKVEAEAE